MRWCLVCAVAASGCADLLGIAGEDGTLALAELSTSKGSLRPAFAPDVLAYDLDLPFSAGALVVTARSQDAAATIVIDGQPTLEGALVAVPLGDAVVTVVAESLHTMTYTIRTHREDLTLSFGPPIEVAGTGMVSAVTAVDFDGDGITDLGFLATGQEIGVLVNDGAARFTFAGTSLFGQARAFTAADIDEDSRPDLLVSASQLWLARGHGDGTYDAGYGQGALGQPGAIAVGRFDGDAHRDVAVVDQARVAVLRGDGLGNLLPGPSVPLAVPPGEPRFLLAAQLDGVRGDDLVALDTVNRRLTVAIDEGGGFSLHDVLTGPGDGPVILAVADLDGDQRGDLAWVDPLGRVGVQLGFPAWTREVHPPDGPSAPHALVAGDLDGDGHVDLVLLDQQGVVVFWNDGTGTMTRKRIGNLLPGATSLAIADLNGDGRGDLALARFTNTVSVFLGRP